MPKWPARVRSSGDSSVASSLQLAAKSDHFSEQSCALLTWRFRGQVIANATS
jgi:hypothetical protein